MRKHIEQEERTFRVEQDLINNTQITSRWSKEAINPVGVQWFDPPKVQANINIRNTGDPYLDWISHSARFFEAIPTPRRALSIGCGFGILERLVRQRDICQLIDGIDLTEEAIEGARRHATLEGIDRLNYRVGDLNTIELPACTYDVVYARAALHHVFHLENLLNQIKNTLKPEGIFIIWDYIGPVQFQFPQAHLELADVFLRMIPEQYRHHLRSPGHYKDEAPRVSLEDISTSDPSEAIRSQEIVSLVASRFELKHLSFFGGTLLLLVLNEIAGNFAEDDPVARSLLDMLIYMENLLLDNGVLPSYHAYLVCQKSINPLPMQTQQIMPIVGQGTHRQFGLPILHPHGISQQTDLGRDMYTMLQPFSKKRSDGPQFERVKTNSELEIVQAVRAECEDLRRQNQVLQEHLEAIRKGKVIRLLNALQHLGPGLRGRTEAYKKKNVSLMKHMVTADLPGSPRSISSELATDLYLSLMKRCLVNWIYGDLEEKPFDPQVRSEGRDWPPPSIAHTMIGLKRLDNLQWCVEDILARNIPGDLIETGVWRGGAVIFMRAILKAHGITNRRVWVADSFAGLPPPNPEKYSVDSGDPHHTFKDLVISLDQVQANFERYGLLDEQVQFLKGWFRDTLPDAPIEQLAVLRLDGDMYESTMDALEHLYPKLSTGGYVIVDDYGAIPSCRQAVQDYRETHGISDEMISIDWTGVYWRRSSP